MPRAPNQHSDLPVSPEPMLGMRLDQINQIMDQLSSTAAKEKSAGPRVPLALVAGAARRRSPIGARQYLLAHEGDGYWDMIAIRRGLYLSITDAIYRRPVRIQLPAEPLFKIRVMLSGALFDANGAPFARAGDVCIQTMSGRAATAYQIPPSSEPFRMLVLHGKASALSEFGLEPQTLGAPFAAIQSARRLADTMTPVASGFSLTRLSNDIFASRDVFSADIRSRFLAAKAEEILCYAIESTRPRPELRAGANRILSRDILRLREAHNILTTNLAAPLSLSELARMVGMNETKLKVGFRELFGETPQAFATRVRLESSLALIQSTDLSFSEISFRVGYLYPANFSQAFRRQFGLTPREARRASSNPS